MTESTSEPQDLPEAAPATPPADPYAGETTQALVDRLAAAPDGWPEPALLEAIFARGAEAVGPLTALLGRDLKDDADETTAGWAVTLLGSLRDPAALPTMLDWLRRAGEDYIDYADDALGAFGPGSVDALLATYTDLSLPDYPRTKAREAALEAAGDDLAARARVAAVLRDRLAALIGLGEEALDEDGFNELAFLVCDLADLADPQARPLIDAAFDADLVDGFIVDRKFINEEYERGGELHTPDPDGWREYYPRQYREHQEGPRPAPRWAENVSIFADDEDDDLKPYPVEPPPPPPVAEPFRHTGPRRGRNDPCWCGSGKKYKVCHMKTDQA